MIALSLQGIRGGVGTSSTLAALSYALSTLGQRVLVVDMCPENTLGLHFNLDYALPGSIAARLLINRFEPASQLQRDMLLLWQNHFGKHLLPIHLHADEAMAEALAKREPAGGMHRAA